MIVKIGSPLKKKDLETSARQYEEEELMFDMDEIKIPIETHDRIEFPDSAKELLPPQPYPLDKLSKLPKTNTKKMFDTFGMDRVDESFFSPLKIFKYLNKPAENSLYESMEMTIPLINRFEFADEHPLIAEIYERVLNEEAYMNQISSKVFEDTNELLNNEEINFIDGFNILGVMFILKKLMDSFEVNLSIENNLSSFGGGMSQSSEPISNVLSSGEIGKSMNYYGKCPKILTLYHLQLLCTNFNDNILVFHFFEETFHNFSEFKKDPTLLKMLLHQLNEYIEEILKDNFKDQFIEGKFLIILPKLSKSNKKILIECHLPYFQKGYLNDLIDCFTDSFLAKYKQSFERVTSHKIFRYCHMKADDLDLWGYKEFKEGLFLEEKIRGGLPYIQPKNGWIRFGLNVANYYQTDGESDWFGNDGNQNEWAVCYCNLGLNDKLSSYEREVYKDLYYAKEVKNKKIDKEDDKIIKTEIGGFGILATFDLNFLDRNTLKDSSLGVSSSKKDEKQSDFFNLQTLEIMDTGFKSHGFCLALQCRVDPKKIKFLERFGETIFIVNDPKDIRPYGILIKKLE